MLDAGPAMLTWDYRVDMTAMRLVADNTPICGFYRVFTGAAL